VRLSWRDLLEAEEERTAVGYNIRQPGLYLRALAINHTDKPIVVRRLQLKGARTGSTEDLIDEPTTVDPHNSIDRELGLKWLATHEFRADGAIFLEVESAEASIYRSEEVDLEHLRSYGGF
jgi:hypothetical protein